MKHRIMAVVLVVLIILAAFPSSLFAEGLTGNVQSQVFKDVNSDYWAADVLNRWARNGLISGYGDKTFRPDSNITRAEFIFLVDKVFGYQTVSNKEFNDVKSTDWYHNAVSRVRNASVIAGYNNCFSPNSPISTQDAAVIVSKAFELQVKGNDKVESFKDSSDISGYAFDYVSFMAMEGYLRIYADNTVRPKKNLTRAEAIALIDNVSGEILCKKGEYSLETVNGNLVIDTPDVTLRNTIVKGDLYLTAGVGDGNAYFDNVTVEGNTYINGGGTHSAVFNNSRLAYVFVRRRDGVVRVVLQGLSSAQTLTFENRAQMVVSAGARISNVDIEEGAGGTAINGEGTIENIECNANGVLINEREAEENISYRMDAGEIVAATAPPSTPPSAPPSTPPSTPSPYTLVWSDDFNGSTINSAYWTAADTGVVYNNELEAYKPDNAYVQNGNLVLEAKPESYKGKNYTSGKLVTQGKKAMTYGRVEIRAKMPEGQGIWPALWMLPEDDSIFGGWPQGGEIDIMELLGHQPNRVYGTIHYGNPHASGQGIYTLPSGSFSNGFHTYAFEWDPGEMRWYIDGNLYHTENSWYSRDTNEADSLTYPAPFNRDFYLILNLAVGGDWPGNPDGSTAFPDKMYVDYVKVYQRNGGIYPPAGERPDNGNSTAREPIDGNYIYNGSFDQQVAGVDGMKNSGSSTDVPNTSYWTFSHVAANDGTAVVSNDSGALKIDISDPGPNPYSVQIYQKPINLEKSDSYRVAFDAKASDSRNMSVKLGSDADRGWANYSGDQTIALTTSLQHYQFDFKMDGDTNAAARLEFNVGNAGANAVWIDNVSVTKLPRDPNASRDALPSGNLIYNGSFDQGSKSMGFWEFNTRDGAKAVGSVNPDIYNRQFRADITKGGTAPDSIILSQSGLNIENGKRYTVSFYARAASNRNIKVNVGSSTDSAVSHSAQQSIDLTTDMTKYSFSFTMADATVPQAQLQFKLGGNTSKVYIDDVSVRSAVIGRDIHVEAENTAASGAITSHDSYVTFGSGSSIEKNIDVPEAGNYVISYMLSTSNDNGWLSIADTDHKEALPNTGGTENWVNATNSVYLEKGIQTISIYGNEVNLDWFEISKDLILGGDMTPSASNWAYWSTDGENAVSTKSVEDGKLKVAITAAGANPWSIGVNQSNIGMEKGRLYRISFDAKSTVDRSIRVSVDKADYTKYLTKDLNINGTMKNYIIDFPMSADDANCTLTFSIGNVSGDLAAAHDVYLDNIRVAEVDDLYCQSFQSINAPVIPEPVVTPPDDGNDGLTNIITDGTFDSDTGSWESYSGAGAVAISAAGGKMMADVTGVGSTNYEPQVKRNNLSLAKDKTYVLTFNASANTDRAVEVGVIDPGNGYQYFGGDRFVLSTASSDYAFTFTAPATTSTASLQFNLGTIPGEESASVNAQVSFDNVRLVEVNNLIADGAFDTDMGSWTKFEGSGSATAGVSGGKLSVDVTGVSLNNYDPQVKRGSLSFTKDGVYVVSFRASSNKDRALEVTVIDPSNGYAYYGGNKYDITTSDKEYAFVITAPASTSTAEFQFNFGTIAGHESTSVNAAVNLDNVVITPVYLPDTPAPPPLVDDDVVNDTFDSGLGSWESYSGAGTVAISAEGGKMVADVTVVGSSNYEPQVKRNNLSLAKDKTYVLTFNASANTDRAVEVGVIDPGNGYQYFGGDKFVLSASSADYTFTFTAPATTSTASLQFNLGTIAGDESTSVNAVVSIDTVRLVEVNNLINDGAFDSDIGGWAAYYGSGMATAAVSGGKLAVEITGVSSDNYDPQVKRGDLSFTKDGVYVISFRASSDTDRAVEVTVIDPANGYAYYGGSTYDITTSEKEYAFVINAPASTTTAELQFNFGKIAGHDSTSVNATVNLDNIVITKVN